MVAWNAEDASEMMIALEIKDAERNAWSKGFCSGVWAAIGIVIASALVSVFGLWIMQ